MLFRSLARRPADPPTRGPPAPCAANPAARCRSAARPARAAPGVVAMQAKAVAARPSGSMRRSPRGKTLRPRTRSHRRKSRAKKKKRKKKKRKTQNGDGHGTVMADGATTNLPTRFAPLRAPRRAAWHSRPPPPHGAVASRRRRRRRRRLASPRLASPRPGRWALTWPTNPSAAALPSARRATLCSGRVWRSRPGGARARPWAWTSSSSPTLRYDARRLFRICEAERLS